MSSNESQVCAFAAICVQNERIHGTRERRNRASAFHMDESIYLQQYLERKIQTLAVDLVLRESDICAQRTLRLE